MLISAESSSLDVRSQNVFPSARFSFWLLATRHQDPDFSALPAGASTMAWPWRVMHPTCELG